ncbi:MAG: hypothetical protein AAGA73_03985 [Pseudomonadota bacterium]
MPFTKLLVGTLMLIGSAMPAIAADFSDPTWPCVQRKVEKLSLGLMWPMPVDPQFTPEDDVTEKNIGELVETLVLRRIELDDTRPSIDAFAERHAGDASLLGQVFAAVFERLSQRRSQIIEGIGDFSLGQIALAEKIDGTRLEMNKLMEAEDPDFDRVDALEEQLDWDQTVYSDRQRSITYLCETPILLEQRLYSVAQMLQAVVQEQ